MILLDETATTHAPGNAAGENMRRILRYNIETKSLLFNSTPVSGAEPSPSASVRPQPGYPAKNAWDSGPASPFGHLGRHFARNWEDLASPPADVGQGREGGA